MIATVQSIGDISDCHRDIEKVISAAKESFQDPKKKKKSDDPYARPPMTPAVSPPRAGNFDYVEILGPATPYVAPGSLEEEGKVYYYVLSIKRQNRLWNRLQKESFWGFFGHFARKMIQKI